MYFFKSTASINYMFNYINKSLLGDFVTLITVLLSFLSTALFVRLLLFTIPIMNEP